MSGSRKCVFTHAAPMANACSYGSADCPRHPTPNLVSAEFSDVGKPGCTALAACLGATCTRLYAIELIVYYYLSLLLRVLVKLDSLIIENVKSQLFAPERMSVILGALVDRQTGKQKAVQDRQNELQSAIKDKKEKLTRLYRAIENDIVELDQGLKVRIKTLKDERDLLQASLERIREQSKSQSALTPERIEAFSNLMREKIDSGDIQARKAYLRAVISEIRVDDHKVSIIGEKTALTALIAGQTVPNGNVSGFVRKWRARNDSNVRPSDS